MEALGRMSRKLSGFSDCLRGVGSAILNNAHRIAFEGFFGPRHWRRRIAPQSTLPPPERIEAGARETPASVRFTLRSVTLPLRATRATLRGSTRVPDQQSPANREERFRAPCPLARASASPPDPRYSASDLR